MGWISNSPSNRARRAAEAQRNPDKAFAKQLKEAKKAKRTGKPQERAESAWR